MNHHEPTRVLVTGAGGPAAVSFLRRLAVTAAEVGPVPPRVDGLRAVLYAVDLDPLGAGLYLVPAGDAPEFVDVVHRLCVEHRIDVLVPTVDSELMPLAKARGRFADTGTTVLVASERTLALCLDKWELARHCSGFDPGPGGGIGIPATALLDEYFEPAGLLEPPVVVKPRVGSGARGVRLVRSAVELAALPRTGDHIVQQYLPGQEYSLDVMAALDGRVCAVVPRLRLKIDSGIAVAGRTEHDAQLEWFGAAVAKAVGLTGVGNVQCRRDDAGAPRLFEVNARFPGTMPLTVAAGVDVPTYLVAEAVLGTQVPERMPFLDVAMVRHWEDVVVEPAAFARTADPRSSLTREFAAAGEAR